MDNTQDPTTGPADPGPNLNRDGVRTLNQLRRSRDDRFVAGVAGGLGRHFGIDPTIVRVLLIALTIVGGAGLLLYAAAWLFIPEEGADGALIHLGDEVLKIVLVVVAAIAVLSILGSGWWWGGGYHGFPWQLGLCAIVIAVVIGFANKRHREEAERAGGTHSHTEFGVPTAAVPAAGQADGQTGGQTGGQAMEATATMPATGGGGAAGSAVAAPPRSPQRPPRPQRTGLVLFWPTLALILVGFGVLGIYANDHHVIASAWPALALAIIGVMLVIGAFVGRPGGLILIGLLTIPPLMVTSVVEDFHWENHTRTYAPASAAAVQDSYRIGNGKMVIDLNSIGDAAQLQGRTIRARMDVGEIIVKLPDGVNVNVTGSLDAAGDVEVGDRDQSGFSPDVTTTLGSGDDPAATFNLDVHGRLGHIQVVTP